MRIYLFAGAVADTMLLLRISQRYYIIRTSSGLIIESEQRDLELNKYIIHGFRTSVRGGEQSFIIFLPIPLRI